METGRLPRELLRSGLVLALGWAVSAPALGQSPIVGVWRTMLQSEVMIEPCPEGYCGYLSTIVVPDGLLSGAEAAAAAQMKPEDFFDYRNKDPKLRSRPMLGLQILTLKPGNRTHIFEGKIYNPEDGNTYAGYMEMLGPDQVRLNGCVLFNLLCRGEDWVRVPRRR